MKRVEFNTVFETLCKYYDKQYNKTDEMVEIYFNEMKYINDDLSQYINKIFSEFKFFPKVSELKDLRYKLQSEKGETININAKVCDCEDCNGTGYRAINEIRSGLPYSFCVACDCANGTNKLYDGSKIQDKIHRSEYTVKRFSNYIPV